MNYKIFSFVSLTILSFLFFIFKTILILLFTFNYFIQIDQVMSDSMKPKLETGDYILSSKIHFYNSKIKRNDIIIFNKTDNSKSLIKRVVGIPGDKIHYENKKLFINNIEQKQIFNVQRYGVNVITEYIDNNPHILYTYKNSNLENDYIDIIIPEDNYFVMGDNRDDSLDSRFFGNVSKHQIKAKYIKTILNTNDFIKNYLL